MRRLASLSAVAMLVVTIGVGASQATTADDGFDALVRRTSNGIPHITGDSWGDVAYGFGYAFAQDNICTAADFYVTVNGERSKWFGPDASWSFNGNGTSNTNRESDFFYTSVNESGRIEELLALPAPHGPLEGVRQGVAGYVAGYNTWLEETGGADGISDPRCQGAEWVKPITEMDTYRRLYQLASLASRGVAIDGLGNAQPPTPSGEAFTAADQAAVDARSIEIFERDFPSKFNDAIGIGSNAYGFGSEATDNGKGMVLGNPHFPWHGGERLYQFHLTVRGSVDVSGASLYGVPLVLIGHTAGMAWSHTVSTAFRFTPMELTLVPGLPTTYLVDGQPVQMTSRTVEIEALQPDGEVATESRTLYSTIYGDMLDSILGLPIFPWTPTKAFAIQDANDQFRYLNHFFETNQAQSVRELYDVIVRNQGVPWVNTIAADSDGEALYSDISVVPNVPDSKVTICNTQVGQATFAALGLPILDGSRSDCNWDTDADAVVPGIFGPSNLPFIFRNDYVHNGNDSYWLTNPRAPITGYARIIGDEEATRSLRTRIGLTMVEERLAGTDEYDGNLWTQEILKDAVFNNRQYAAELVRDDLVTLCQSLPGGMAPVLTLPNPTELETSAPVFGPPVDVSGACPILAAWDLRDNLDSPGAALFRRFWRHVDTAFGASTGPWVNQFDASDPVNTPNTLNANQPQVAGALGRAVSDFNDAGFALDVTLREVQYEDRGDGERIPIHGGPGTLGVFNAINVGWSNAQGGWPDVSHGSSFVMAVQFTDGCPITNAIVTYSQSEDRTSPWFKDQTKMFSDKQWNSMPFCDADILADPNLTVQTLSSSAAAGPVATAVPGPLPATGGGAVLAGAAAGVAVIRRRRSRRR
ncbi:MAG: acyl-homoserine-lactone acylase [Glaciecola sp.]|jgi:acyl-homoserine-lactone acylase